MMAHNRIVRLLGTGLALLIAGCGNAGGGDPSIVAIDPSQITWQSPEGAFWGTVDVLERDGVMWVLSSAEPFVHGLESGADVAAFGTQGDGPGEFRSARALLPLGDVGQITVWDAGSRLHRTFSREGRQVSTREARALGTVRGDIDAVTFGDPLRLAATADGAVVRAEYAGAVMWGGDLWTGALVRTSADGSVERLVEFADLRGASHEDLRTKRALVPVPLWDACPDGSVVVLDPVARLLHRVASSWEERDSVFVPWEAGPLGRTERLSYLAGQMKTELQGQQVESRQMEEMLVRAEEGSRDQFPASAPLAVDVKCAEGRVWLQEYDGAAHPLGFGRRWRTISPANPASHSVVILPAGFQLFRASGSRLLGVATDDLDLQRIATIALP